MLVGALNQADDFRDGALAETLRCPHAHHPGEVDAPGHHLVLHRRLARHAFAGEGQGVQRSSALDNRPVQRHFLAGLDDYHLAHPDLLRGHGHRPAFTLHIGHVRPDVHQMGDAVTAPPLRIGLEQFADLEKQHNEYRFRKLRLRTRQEAYAQRAEGGQRHQEMLVEHVSMPDAPGRLQQCLAADKQVRNQVNQQQLPGLPTVGMFQDYGRDEQQRGHCNQCDFALQASGSVGMMMVVVVCICHNFLILFTAQRCEKNRATGWQTSVRGRRCPLLATDDTRRLRQTSLAAPDMRQTSIVIDNFTPPDIDRCAFFYNFATQISPQSTRIWNQQI